MCENRGSIRKGETVSHGSRSFWEQCVDHPAVHPIDDDDSSVQIVPTSNLQSNVGAGALYKR